MEASSAPAAEESQVSTFDTVTEPDMSQQPIQEEDQHGSVTPTASPPAGPHAGIDPVGGQAVVPPAGAAGVGAGAAGESGK
jgi:hypothetical protein